MRKKDWISLEKMLGYAQTAISFCEGIDSYEDFLKDNKTNMASAFVLIQIGEISVEGLSDEFRQQIASIPWTQIKGLRNRIVHGYDEVDLHMVFETIKQDMPALAEEITVILQKHSAESL